MRRNELGIENKLAFKIKSSYWFFNTVNSIDCHYVLQVWDMWTLNWDVNDRRTFSGSGTFTTGDNADT